MQENVNAVDKVNADNQRKTFISSLIMVFVLIVCIILAIFAWFVFMRQDRALLSTGALYSAGNLNISYSTYAGNVLSDGSIEYDMSVNWNRDFEQAGENIPEINTYPGQRRYFKTVIANNESRQLTGKLFFKNMLVNTNFITTQVGAEYVNFQSRIEGQTNLQAFDLINNSDVIQGEDYSLIPLQPICEGITLPANTSQGENSNTVTIYWYVTLNGANVRNDVGELFLKFQEITFIENQ